MVVLNYPSLSILVYTSVYILVDSVSTMQTMLPTTSHMRKPIPHLPITGVYRAVPKHCRASKNPREAPGPRAQHHTNNMIAGTPLSQAVELPKGGSRWTWERHDGARTAASMWRSRREENILLGGGDPVGPDFLPLLERVVTTASLRPPAFSLIAVLRAVLLCGCWAALLSFVTLDVFSLVTRLPSP